MTKDNDWKEIEASFIRGRDDGKEYGVPTIVVNPDTLRVGIQSLLDRQREDIAREVEGLKRNLTGVMAVGSSQGMYNQALKDVLARLRAPNHE